MKSTKLFILILVLVFSFHNSLAAIPVINNLSPNCGTAKGGTVVTIQGSAFSEVNTVWFGTVPVDFTIDSDNQITVTAPQSVPGIVNISLSTPLVTSYPSFTSQYVYQGDWLAYATNTRNDTISLINLSEKKLQAMIKTNNPLGIVLTPDGSKAFVANQENKTIEQIDLITHTVTATIPLESQPFGLAITPDGNTLYAALPNNDTIVPIDTTTGNVGTPISVKSPMDLAITPNNKFAYVVNYLESTVTFVDLSTGTPLQLIGVGVHPLGIAISPNGKTAYVANSGTNTLSFIDLNINSVYQTVDVGNAPSWINLSQDGMMLYTSNYDDNTVTPVRLGKNTPLTPISVGCNPNGIAIAPDGKTIYVANSGDFHITPIDLCTFQAGEPIEVGYDPDYIAITPDQAPLASFTVLRGAAGTPTQFDASLSASPVGTIINYSWNFGDGYQVETTSPLISHIYGTMDTFTVQLTVKNSAGTTTRQVYTGQCMINNGGPSATLYQTITISNVSDIPVVKPVITPSKHVKPVLEEPQFTAQLPAKPATASEILSPARSRRKPPADNYYLRPLEEPEIKEYVPTKRPPKTPRTPSEVVDTLEKAIETPTVEEPEFEIKLDDRDEPEESLPAELPPAIPPTPSETPEAREPDEAFVEEDEFVIKLDDEEESIIEEFIPPTSPPADPQKPSEIVQDNSEEESFVEETPATSADDRIQSEPVVDETIPVIRPPTVPSRPSAILTPEQRKEETTEYRWPDELVLEDETESENEQILEDVSQGEPIQEEKAPILFPPLTPLYPSEIHLPDEFKEVEEIDDNDNGWPNALVLEDETADEEAGIPPVEETPVEPIVEEIAQSEPVIEEPVPTILLPLTPTIPSAIHLQDELKEQAPVEEVQSPPVEVTPTEPVIEEKAPILLPALTPSYPSEIHLPDELKEEEADDIDNGWPKALVSEDETGVEEVETLQVEETPAEPIVKETAQSEPVIEEKAPILLPALTPSYPSEIHLPDELKEEEEVDDNHDGWPHALVLDEKTDDEQVEITQVEETPAEPIVKEAAQSESVIEEKAPILLPALTPSYPSEIHLPDELKEEEEVDDNHDGWPHALVLDEKTDDEEVEISQVEETPVEPIVEELAQSEPIVEEQAPTILSPAIPSTPSKIHLNDELKDDHIEEGGHHEFVLDHEEVSAEPVVEEPTQKEPIPEEFVPATLPPVQPTEQSKILLPEEQKDQSIPEEEDHSLIPLNDLHENEHFQDEPIPASQITLPPSSPQDILLPNEIEEEEHPDDDELSLEKLLREEEHLNPDVTNQSKDHGVLPLGTKYGRHEKKIPRTGPTP